MNRDEIIGALADDTIEIEHHDDGGMSIFIDTSTELGERIEWQAGHAGETPGEFVRKAVEESLERSKERRR